MHKYTARDQIISFYRSNDNKRDLASIRRMSPSEAEYFNGESDPSSTRYKHLIGYIHKWVPVRLMKEIWDKKAQIM